MPRTIWSGAISFGLVTVPIHVQSATDDHAIKFHQYHLEDGGRVRVRKVCELEDREVANAEIGKGYEYAKDQIVPVSDQELRELPLPTAKAIEIVAFVPRDTIDPIRIGEGYYLAPDGPVAAKPYLLLVKALGRSSRVAIAKYAWSGRERLGMCERIAGNSIAAERNCPSEDHCGSDGLADGAGLARVVAGHRFGIGLGCVRRESGGCGGGVGLSLVVPRHRRHHEDPLHGQHDLRTLPPPRTRKREEPLRRPHGPRQALPVEPCGPRRMRPPPRNVAATPQGPPPPGGGRTTPARGR
ncbi:Ku protein [Streptomyces sp. NPDC046909]|uniref:non-homologous end joining protein Ku n=1 Tax=Streptomyces sp. NPDC046909 TaxID=3155617 RepID=UPI0034109AEA